ncbi:hypothetical protein ACJMK2_027333 [Sinanodonta woodiana]|uniref:Ig-like domain-containing protein n=1 Tax=Sinanodonta woodiana TaxID=1069815 RepID=A0ABD3XMG3_SINWO
MTWNVTCEASGFPTNYTFHPWKQLLGQDTIRSHIEGNQYVMINSSKTTLILHRLALQDLGTYVCSVDNGVRGDNGDVIQTSATVLKVKGTSLLLNKTNAKFTGEIGSSVNIYVAFYSDPPVTIFKFQKNGSNIENTSRSHMYLSTTVVEVLFYNKNVNLTVFMAHLLIMNLTDDDFDDYNLVLENSLGKTDLRVQLHLSGNIIYSPYILQ